MAEKLCTLRTKGAGGGGKKYTETSLWTNPSPNSTFAAQNVTLSDSIDNYKYIAIKYSFNTQLQTGTYISTMIAAVDDVKKWGYNTGAHHVIGSTSMQNNQNNLFSRGCFYISSTSIRFSAGTQVGATTSNNDILIPLEILGLNELDHAKGFDETVLWTNPSPSSGMGAQTVTLSDDINNYDYIKINFKVTGSIMPNMLIPVSDLKSAGTKELYSMTYNGGSVYVCRMCSYISDTEIRFYIPYSLNTSGSNNNVAIPQSIIGCKFR